MSMTDSIYVCKYCGKSFSELPSKYASGDFCSKECARKYSSQFANTNEMRTIKSNTACDKLNIPHKSNEYITFDEYGNIHHKPRKLKKKFCKICGQEECLHPEICKLGIIQQKSKALSALSFNFSKVGTIEIYNEYFKVKDFLYDLYTNKEKSILDIMKEYQIKHIRSLELLFIRFEIPRRTFSDSCLLAYAKDKISPPVCPRYKTGWHTTWEGKSYFHRSSYELDYMNELDEKQIPYDCEALRIRYYDSVKQKYRTAIPDFYLPDTKTIVEVKCRRTYNKQEMIDKVKEYKRLGFSFRLLYEHIMYDNCI